MSHFGDTGRIASTPEPLMMRPGEDGVRVRLKADPWLLARAAATCATARIPVDAAVALCCDTLAALPARASNAPMPDFGDRRSAVEPGVQGWIDQLRYGCRWHEDTLPFVLVPARVAHQLRCDPRPALRLAGMPDRLAWIIAAEIAAVSTGDTAEAMPQNRRRCAAPVQP